MILTQHVTVVYYNSKGETEAFHVESINTERLQSAFNKHDVYIIKYFIIERVSSFSNSFKTMDAESEIKAFLDLWKIDF